MLILLDLLSAIALLIWGTHTVRTGILSVYGADLRRMLGQSVSNRFKAMLAGLGVTSLVQSSTATSLIAASFVEKGLITTSAALAIMLGADIGSSLMVQLFSLDLSWLSPMLILGGVILFITREKDRVGRIGRVAIGLGLIILALQLIVAATRPITQGEGLRLLFSTLTGDFLLDVLIGTLVTMLAYSSIAVVLLTATLAASGVLALPVALALAVGANLGSSMVGVISTWRSEPEARRVPLGNLIFKVTGSIVVLMLAGPILQALLAIDPDPHRLVVNFHLGFNVAIALIFLFLTEPIARLVTWMLPSHPVPQDPGKPRHLDPVALATPSLAIALAAREALRIGDTIETMLNGMLRVIRENDSNLAASLRKMDDTVDDLYTGIKLYLTQIRSDMLDNRESRRWTEIISFVINMEQVGDIIERVLIDLEEKKISKRRSFSSAGMEEICDLHARLVANLRLSLSVFLNGELKGAQTLIGEKERFRDLERAYASSHISRLADNTLQSIETSSLHLDLISDLKRINSHICSIAYPILEEAGVLHSSRLRGVAIPAVTPESAKQAAATDGESASDATLAVRHESQ